MHKRERLLDVRKDVQVGCIVTEKVRGRRDVLSWKYWFQELWSKRIGWR